MKITQTNSANACVYHICFNHKTNLIVFIRFTVKETSWGPYVVSIYGLEAKPSLRQYWSLINAKTNEPLSLGVGQYRPSHGDHILFRLATY